MAKTARKVSKKVYKRKSQGPTELDHICVLGAKEHNLKNIDINIPKKKLVTITGVSGSGKSSLAFDTIYAEGQRRYVESLSSYARQFLGQMDKPSFESIRGLSPTIAIEQKSSSTNPRSTVGTITEIYDYLRVLFARTGTQYCPKCGKEIGTSDSAQIVKNLMKYPVDTKAVLLAPIIENRKGEYKDLLKTLISEGYTRIRVDGTIIPLNAETKLTKNKKHNLEVVIDRLQFKNTTAFKKRLTESVEQALTKSSGRLILNIPGRQDVTISEKRTCCGISYPDLDPATFSFNSPQGMCKSCNGIGTIMSMDESKIIPDKNLTIREGAIKPWANTKFDDEESGWVKSRIEAMVEQWGLDIDTPWKKLPAKIRKGILHGGKAAKLKTLTVNWKSSKYEGSWESDYEGLLNALFRRYKKTKSDSMKKWYGKYMSEASCKSCDGNRLQPWINHILVNEKNITEITKMRIGEASVFFKKLKFTGSKKTISEGILKEINSRLHFLNGVGLQYLSLDRKGPSLSGGESQRIRLASQIGSELTGVLYVLDEPSIGLHQRDNKKLIETLKHLRDIGNSVLVVEHDEETIRESDWVIDIGQGAGHLGGQVIAEGTPKQIIKQKSSVTAQYLNGKKTVFSPEQRNQVFKNHEFISLYGANSNNLKNVDLKLPLGVFTSITGVSGAGKSTLVSQTLYPILQAYFGGNPEKIGEYKKIEGLDQLSRVVNINQRPIGRTPRSNPATYTKLFDHIRDFYAQLPESRLRGYKPGRFSFNVKGGRCEACKGDGFIKVEMHFLADVYVPCEACDGKRFNEQTLGVTYKGHSISDILELSVTEARVIFDRHPKIRVILDTLIEVGLSYIKLGQPATTLSGGEAQRIKLSRELSKSGQRNTLFLLDEPTTGLHFQDVSNLLKVLHKLVKIGNTVCVIEHNTDVIRSSDWVIDIGPEGGDGGGEIVFEGTPEKLAKNKRSHTAPFV